jgi:phage major head subunit gpT-like protein
MELNAANRAMLSQGYNASFQVGLMHRPPMWQEAAMLVPSTTSENVYDWLKDTFKIREWMGDRNKQNIATADYVVKNRKFEGTIGVNRDKVADNQYGSYNKRFEQMGQRVSTFPDSLVFQLMKAGFSTNCWDGQYFFDVDHPVGLQGSEVSVSNFMGGAGEAWYIMDSKQLMKPFIFQEREKFKLVIKDKDTDDNVFDRNELVYGVDGRCNAAYGLWQLCFASKQTLDVANVKAALTAFGAQRDDSGEPLQLDADTIFVSPNLREAARDLFSKELIANETNTLKNRLNVVSSGFLL